MRRARLSSLLCGALALAADAAASGGDASALVQESVRSHRRAAEVVNIGSSLVDTPSGPTAITSLGEIRGVREENFTIFRGIPYSERIPRWHAPTPKAPWQPETLDATEFGPACIGSHVGLDEAEDCLYLNIWLPNTRFVNMPVIIYFHGGINQHGSGFEPIRQGDGITQCQQYPTIFVNFDFRMGIFGWISLPGSNISDNLGLQDQQAALRWVHDHIAAFGGDPSRVTLQGQSEGSGIILVHMVAPGSKDLFQRAVFHSPVADFWSRNTNADRTQFMIGRTGCARKMLWSTVRCLKRKDPRRLWEADWVSEELSRGIGGPVWTRHLMGLASFALAAKDKEEVIGQLGWHAVVDGRTLLAEPRDLVREGKFNKASVLITVSKNESYGTIPGGDPFAVELGLKRLLPKNHLTYVKAWYNKTLLAQGINVGSTTELVNEILTDKLWTCDARALADHITAGGGKAHLGMFWHSPKYDFLGQLTSPICEHGATCHASEMYYVLPQSGDRGGIHGPTMQGEIAFSEKYSRYFLAFVHGNDTGHPWKAWDQSRPLTFVSSAGTRVVPNYRGEQCDLLDREMGEHLPEFMRRISTEKRAADPDWLPAR